MSDVYQELYALIERAPTPLKAIEIATDLVPPCIAIEPINKNALYLLALRVVLLAEEIRDPSAAIFEGDSLSEALDAIQASASKVVICNACGYLVDRVKKGFGNAGLDYTVHYLTALHRLRNIYRSEQERGDINEPITARSVG